MFLELYKITLESFGAGIIIFSPQGTAVHEGCTSWEYTHVTGSQLHTSRAEICFLLSGVFSISAPQSVYDVITTTLLHEELGFV